MKKTHNPAKAYLNAEEAASLLRISKLTLYEYARRGLIPHYRPFGKNGRLFFIEEELVRLIEKEKSNG